MKDLSSTPLMLYYFNGGSIAGFRTGIQNTRTSPRPLVLEKDYRYA
jgi:hypothetical protein